MLRNELGWLNKLHPTEKCLMAWSFIPEYSSPNLAPSYFDISRVTAYPLLMASPVGVNGHGSSIALVVVRGKLTEQGEASDR